MSKANWEEIQLYFSGDEYFRDAIKAIEKAQTEIWIESYIFDMDPIGQRLLNAAKEARLRGVHVHILVDGVGSYNWVLNLKAFCKLHHIQFRVYHPLPFKFELLKTISWRSLRRILFLMRRMNKRNHRKVILIDNTSAFLGSMNISQVHTKEFMGNRAWRDTGIQVKGSSLNILRRACHEAWSKSKFEGRSFVSSFLKRRIRFRNDALDFLRLNSHMRWRYRLLRDFNRRIRNAEHRILITNGYFLPRKSVLRSLKKAAKRGVYVGICLPEVTDFPPVKWAARSLYHRLVTAGVHIYEYQGHTLHAKTLIIDGWATVGSHNLNHRSLTHDLEVEAVLNKPEWVSELLQQWDEDTKNSKAITLRELGKLKWYHLIFARFFYWFRYWI